MDRRPVRWHPAPGPARVPRPPRGPGSRMGHVIVLAIILGGLLLIGLAAPPVYFESLLAWFGFR